MFSSDVMAICITCTECRANKNDYGFEIPFGWHVAGHLL